MSAYVQTVVGSDSPPVGAVMDFAGNVEPSGWLFCFGQSLPRTGIYAQLFQVIGTLYGSVDGSSFSLPDFRGRVGAGKDDMGGTAANRLQTAWGVNGVVLGANGGSQFHQLTVTQLAAHTHTEQRLAFTTPYNANTVAGTTARVDYVQNSGSTGEDEAHPNIQPTFIVNKIIKYTVSGTVLPIVPGEGDVVGPDGGVADGDLAVFAGTSGKMIKRGSLFPRGHLSGLGIANNATDATNDIDISEGECRDSTNSVDIKLPVGITKRLDAAWAAGTNQGGLDTGAIANTTYHVHAIGGSGVAADVLFSTSATAPILPASYTHFRRIASIRRVSAAIADFRQLGDNFNTVGIVDYSSASARANALFTVSVPLGIICRPVFQIGIAKGTAGDAWVTIQDTTGNTGGSVSVRVGLAGERDGSLSNSAITNTSAQVNMSVTISGGTITECIIRTIGWIDRRGQDD